MPKNFDASYPQGVRVPCLIATAVELCSAINRLSIASTSTNFLSLVFVTQNVVLFSFGTTQKVL